MIGFTMQMFISFVSCYRVLFDICDLQSWRLGSRNTSWFSCIRPISNPCCLCSSPKSWRTKKDIWRRSLAGWAILVFLGLHLAIHNIEGNELSSFNCFFLRAYKTIGLVWRFQKRWWCIVDFQQAQLHQCIYINYSVLKLWFSQLQVWPCCTLYYFILGLDSQCGYTIGVVIDSVAIWLIASTCICSRQALALLIYSFVSWYIQIVSFNSLDWMTSLDFLYKDDFSTIQLEIWEAFGLGPGRGFIN